MVVGFAAFALALDVMLFRHDVVAWCTPRQPAIALTFDDGPDPAHTPLVLDALAASGAKATFFVVGEHAAEHPDLVRRMLDEGHEVAHHTHTHPHVDELDDGPLRREFDEAVAVLRSHGVEPAWYRPPRKRLTLQQKRLAAEHGMRVALWTRSVERTRFRATDEMVDVVVAETRPGDVLLAHDGRLDRSMTVRALPGILDGLSARGFRFVTLTELHGMDRTHRVGPIALPPR